MTRDTDSSSSGPQGRGGNAYPSGTQPYGAGRPFPSLHPQERTRPEDAEDAAAAGQEGAAEQQQPAPDEPRTETTLTTRIRINIPGSRPIPPVVVRTAVDESASASGSASAQGAGGAGEQEPAQAEAPAPAPEPQKKPASDWFSPRKPAQGQGPGADQGQPPAAQAPPATPAAPPGAPFGAPPAAGETTASGLPYRSGAAPSAGGTAGHVPFAGTQTPGATPYLPPPVGGVPGEDESVRGGHETPSGGFPSPFAAQAPPFGSGSPFDTAAMPPVRDDGAPYDTGANPAVGGPYDTGANPVVGGPYDTGANPVVGDPYDTGANPAVGGPYDTGAQSFGTQDFPPGVPRPTDAGDQPHVPFGGRLEAPAGPTAGPVTGSVNIPPLDPPTGGGSSDTLVSGMPTVPSAGSGPRFPESTRRPAQPFATGSPQPPAPGAGPGSHPGPGPAPKPEPARPAPAKSAPGATAKPAKKGRSKPVLAGVAVVALLVVAYGAGLVMNHSDVPKGTTVLGVDIGNQNRDAAAKMLDTALGDRASAPLTLNIGGRKATLKPSVAGLSIDTDATIQNVAHSDYNPVSVIGSLFGGSRTADPVYVMDEDKLKSALQALAGSTSAATDGMVRFEDHKAIAVPGKPGHSFDVAAAVTQVEAAYRTRVETQANPVITLGVTTTKPKVTQAQLDAAVNGFGKKAMSGPVIVRANATQFVTFNKTLPKFLTMVPTKDGTLAPHIDLVKLKELVGTAFKGVLIERGDGSKTPVTPQDVATALMQGLNASGPDRTVTLPGVV